MIKYALGDDLLTIEMINYLCNSVWASNFFNASKEMIYLIPLRRWYNWIPLRRWYNWMHLRRWFIWCLYGDDIIECPKYLYGDELYEMLLKKIIYLLCRHWDGLSTHFILTLILLTLNSLFWCYYIHTFSIICFNKRYYANIYYVLKDKCHNIDIVFCCHCI